MFPFNIAGGKGGVSLASSAASGDIYAGDMRSGASTSGSSGLIPGMNPSGTVTLALLLVAAAVAYRIIRKG